MASALAPPEYEEAHDGLARALRSRRSDCQPHELARQLLEYDQPGHTALVGIDGEARSAILYHERDRYAIAVTIDSDGLADGGAKVAGSQHWPGIDSWVKLRAAYWGWLYPRFR